MSKGKQLPKRAETMGRKLLGMVMATTSQLRSGTDLSAAQAKRGMQDLRERNFVRSVAFGCLLPKVDHHFLTTEGLDFFEASDEQRSWHSLDAVGNLLIYDLLKVEAVNDIATLCVTDGWKLEGVQWFEGQEPAMDAVAAYRHPDHDSPAYRVFCCTSPMNNEWERCRQLEQLPESLRAQAVHPTKSFYPADLCIVEADEWGAARSLSVAVDLLYGWISFSQITAWYYDGDGWRVSDGPSTITGSTPMDLAPFEDLVEATTNSLRPVASGRKLGPRYFDRILNASIWETGRGRALFHVLRVLCDYSVISAPHLTALAGKWRNDKGQNDKGQNDKETPARLAELMDLGLAVMEVPKVRTSARLRVSRRGHGGPRFGPTAAGRHLMWLAWRCRPKDLYTRSEHSFFESGKWSCPHQDATYEILAQFREEGRTVAPGWRAHATLANGNTIEPDGMVWASTRWGRLWCFLEVEFSDTSVRAFKTRCERYGSGDRLESHPLFMVLRNELAETNFRQAVAQFAPDLRVMTTNLRRLRRGGVMGSGVWRYPQV